MNKALDLQGDAAEAAQQFLAEALKESESAHNRFMLSYRMRFYLAVTLKGIALFGGLAVATLDISQVVLGVVISAAVLFDQLFSNHKKMMAEAIAADAIDRTIRKVKDNYNDQVLDVVQANSSGDAAIAHELLFKLARQSAKTIRDELNRIKIAVAEVNIQYLSSLNIDQPATTSLPRAAGGEN